jgi:hypothetical protein
MALVMSSAAFGQSDVHIHGQSLEDFSWILDTEVLTDRRAPLSPRSARAAFQSRIGFYMDFYDQIDLREWLSEQDYAQFQEMYRNFRDAGEQATRNGDMRTFRRTQREGTALRYGLIREYSCGRNGHWCPQNLPGLEQYDVQYLSLGVVENRVIQVYAVFNAHPDTNLDGIREFASQAYPNIRFFDYSSYRQGLNTGSVPRTYSSRDLSQSALIGCEGSIGFSRACVGLDLRGRGDEKRLRITIWTNPYQQNPDLREQVGAEYIENYRLNIFPERRFPDAQPEPARQPF